MHDKLEDLYTNKGKLTFEIQVAQAKLQVVDAEIIKIINDQNQPLEAKKEVTKKGENNEKITSGNNNPIPVSSKRMG